MKKKKSKPALQRYSFFFICFISYLILFLFTIVSSIYNYSAFWKKLQQQRAQYDTVIFRQLDEMLSSKIDRVEALLADIVTDVDLMRTTSVKDLVSSDQLSKTLRASSRLRDYHNKYNQTQISRLYIYYKDANAIVIDTAYYQLEDFYQAFIDSEKISFENWKTQKLMRNCTRSFEPSILKGNETLAVYHSISDGKSQGAQIVLEFDIQDIYRSFETSYTTDIMAFYIIDENGTKLFNHGSGNMEVPPDSGQFLEPYISRRTGWTYYSAIPASVYNKELNDAIREACILVFIQLLVGIPLCFLFARSNSKPIRNLSSKIVKLTTQGRENRNEHYLVDSYFSKLESERTELMTEYNQAMKSNMIRALLNGTLSGRETMGTYQEEIGIHFQGNDFQVACIQIEYSKNQREIKSLEEQSLLRYFLIDKLTESLKPIGNVYFIDMTWNQSFLLLNGTDLERNAEKIYGIFETLKNDLEKDYQSYLTIGIGEIHTGLEQVFISRMESITALEYKILRGQGSVSTYRDSCMGNASSWYLPAINKSQIKSKIRAGDSEGAIESLHQIIKSIFSNHHDISLEMAKYLFFEIMSLGMDALTETNLEPGNQVEYKAQLFECQTLEQLQSTLTVIFTEICENIEKRKKSHSQILLDRILEYTEKNYRDSNFSLVGVADYLGITPPYLSSFFKEKNGNNFMDYLTGMRIQTAKDILIHSDASISGIGLSLGYSSSGSFIRAFKKIEGITPTQFRESNPLEQHTGKG